MAISLKALNKVLTRSMLKITKQAMSESGGRAMAGKSIRDQIDNAIEDFEHELIKEEEKINGKHDESQEPIIIKDN
tara:strand:+ start:652 stop:879 length:228 start_codon:yes stop_codon:yes gene_type:complete